MEQMALWEEERPVPPSEDELGIALLTAARLAVRKRYRGDPPPGMDFDDLASEVSVLALGRVRKWRPGGKKTLPEYAYVSCCFALTDWLRKRGLVRDVERDLLDATPVVPLEALKEAV